MRVFDRFSGMSVLVVDDNSENLALLAALLEDGGMHRITLERDSRRVKELLPEVNPDLVLLDLHMPHLDGHAVLPQITHFAAGTYLPVLVLTADDTGTSRNRALANGARDFLTKPFDYSEATLRIANLLETRNLYTALKHSSKGRIFEQRSGCDEAQERAWSHIRAVLSGSTGLEMALQPVVDIDTFSAVGYEALARFTWPHERGPAGWFSDAFDMGAGPELEWLAVGKSIPLLADADPATFIAVNLSPATILTLPEHGLADFEQCPRLVIELTEHVPIEDYSALSRALNPLREVGVRLAADDLGSGYAGFRHLVSLEPDIIKLDISLVRGIERSRGQRALASALVAFADDVGAVVIAEGIEESAELAVLQEVGVSWGQGYYLGRPAIPEKSPRLIA